MLHYQVKLVKNKGVEGQLIKITVILLVRSATEIFNSGGALQN